MSAPSAPTPDALLLNAMLAVEHGLLYGAQEALGIAVGAGAPGVTVAVLQTSVDSHRDLRDRLADLLDKQGVTPSPAAAAYALPTSGRDVAGACELAAAMEDRGGATWLDAVGRTSDHALRTMCADALSQSAVRGLRLREAAGQPAAQILPSYPGR